MSGLTASLLYQAGASLLSVAVTQMAPGLNDGLAQSGNDSLPAAATTSTPFSAA